MRLGILICFMARTFLLTRTAIMQCGPSSLLWVYDTFGCIYDKLSYFSLLYTLLSMTPSRANADATDDQTHWYQHRIDRQWQEK